MTVENTCKTSTDEATAIEADLKKLGMNIEADLNKLKAKHQNVLDVLKLLVDMFVKVTLIITITGAGAEAALKALGLI